jgi:hypothetical protein
MGGGNELLRKNYETKDDYSLRFVGLSTQLINKMESPNLAGFPSDLTKDIYSGLDKVAEYIGRQKLTALKLWELKYRTETGMFITLIVIVNYFNGLNSFTIIVVQSVRPVTAIRSNSGLIRCMASLPNGKATEFIIT